MGKMVKVLHVVGAMNKAGTESMIMNIYRNIDRDRVNFDFIYFTERSTDYDDEIKSLGGRIIKLSNPNKVGIIRSILEMKAAMKKYGPYDVLHAHTLFNCGISVFAAWLAGIKVRISHAHTLVDNNCRSIIRNIYFRTMRTIIKIFSTKFLACSEAAAKYLFGEKILTSKKYEWFPNLIDYKKLMNVDMQIVSELRESLKLSEPNIIIGHIGRFVPEKNHKFIIEILRELSKKNINYQAIFIGDGLLRQRIEDEAKGLKVEFLGIRDDIPELLHLMDIFILPSIYEGLGLVLLEAQACGIHSITSEAIQPEADLGMNLITKLSCKDDIAPWVDKIVELKSNKENNVNRIKAAFETKGYSVSKGIDRLMYLYKIIN